MGDFRYFWTLLGDFRYFWTLLGDFRYFWALLGDFRYFRYFYVLLGITFKSYIQET